MTRPSLADYTSAITDAIRARGQQDWEPGGTYRAIIAAIAADGPPLDLVRALIEQVPAGTNVSLQRLAADLRMARTATGDTPPSARPDPLTPGQRAAMRRILALAGIPIDAGSAEARPGTRDTVRREQMRADLARQPETERMARLRQWAAEMRHILVDSPGCAPRGQDERLDLSRLRESGHARITVEGPDASRVCPHCREIIWHPGLPTAHPADGLVREMPVDRPRRQASRAKEEWTMRDQIDAIFGSAR